MKKLKVLPLMMVPLLAISCSGGGKLEIPVVDVENLQITLPEKPTFNQGDVKTDGTYDYIDLYELSDFHGAVNYEEGSSEVRMGLGRMSSYFQAKRALNPGGCVVISGGDMWQGSADSNLTRGYVVTQSMNYMGFDSMTLGNHEFDWTDEWIKKNSSIADFPLVCANLTDIRTGQRADFVKASTVVTRGDYKVGIIGTIGHIEYSIIASAIENYKFEDEGPIVSAEAARLRSEEGCDIVVWSSHNNVKSMATSVTGIDAAFGGHEHLNHTDVINGIAYYATEDYGVDVAHVQLRVNKETKAVDTNWAASGIEEAISFAGGLAEEEKVSSIRSQYAVATDEIKHIKIGSCSDTLKLDNQLANLCVKAMAEEANRFYKENNLEIEDVVASFHNRKGGVRCDIAAGEIKYGDVYSAFPFDNELVIVPMLGGQMQTKFMDNSVRGYANFHTMKDLSSLERTKTYYFCTTDYLATGKVFDLKEKDFIKTGVYVRDIVAQKIKDSGNVKAGDYENTKTEFSMINY